MVSELSVRPPAPGQAAAGRGLGRLGQLELLLQVLWWRGEEVSETV